MLINESGICRQIKKAWKRGYKVYLAGDEIIINASYWVYVVPMKNIPPRVLGLLVEHIGGLVIDRGLKIQKDVPNQIIMDEAIKQEVGFLVIPFEKELREVPLIYKGRWQMYQYIDNGNRLAGLDTDFLDMMEDRAFPFASDDGQMIAFDSETGQGRLIICPMSRKDENLLLNHLEQFDFSILKNVE